jgi:hypothetical protein
MQLAGGAKGTAAARIKLADLTKMNLGKGKINADLTLTDLHYAMDSMVADLGKTHAKVQIPNAAPSKPKVNWACIDLNTESVDFSMATPLVAKLQKSAIRLEAGDVLSKDPVLYAAVDLQSDYPVEAQMDSMGGVIDAPKLHAYAEYNTKDTTVMPVLQAKLDCKALDGFFKDISGKLKATQLEASVSGGRKDKSAPRLKADLRTDGLQARMGEELKAKMNTMIEAAILSAFESNLFQKKSGMVFEFKCWVITRVRRPRIAQGIREPMKAFPRPIQVDATPKFHPNCPA